MVASAKAMSNFFVPGAKRPVQGAYTHAGVRPIFFAIAAARSTSYPRGFETVVPRTVPEAKPTVGSPKATVSLPDSSVGGADVRAKAADATTSAAATASTGRKRFTSNPPIVLGPEKGQIYLGPAGGTSRLTQPS